MKNRLNYYPLVRRSFGTIKELGEVINRSESYCKQRLNGKFEFTFRERKLIADYLEVEVKEISA